MWWMWCIGGLLGLVIELIQPAGFFIFFFGVGALLTGVIIGIAGDGTLESWVQWAIFPALSVVCLVLFRAKLAMIFGRGGSAKWDAELVGEHGTVADAQLEAGGMGTVELRGTRWQAKNDSTTSIMVGARVRVTRVAGLTVHVVAAQ